MQTQNTTKEVTFDESGQTIETLETAAGAEAQEEIVDAEEAEETAAPAAKYRIGEREFATQEEALTYAQSQVSTLETEAQVADAYRQGIRDASINPATSAAPVTQQAAPAISTEEFYSDPQKFLEKYAAKIKSDALSEINQRDSLRAQSDQIWREFTDRHPGLADFRSDVEAFANSNADTVRGIAATKGQISAYDYVATKLKADFAKKAEVFKPRRELSNATAAASPTARGAGVTTKEPAKKELTFSEQIRSIRKRR